ncbi:hypothetical protein [Calidifontibacillus erzurumensis]|uniref:hypothetical protein n=1 Tax=Calidifontibacillus erzurumensis TaxID=2741433 RepID=UPI0035B50D13
MDYLEQAKNEIRERWFKNHKIKSLEGQAGFQRIVWGEEGTIMYQIVYVLSGNMVFITGDLGDAVYSLTCAATLENIKRFNLSYFTEKITASERDKYDFDASLAQQQIEKYFLNWCNVSHVDQLKEEDKELFEELLFATNNWNRSEHFEQAVFSIYEQTSVDWFDSEAASCIADCGKQLNRSLIAYWVGLQMVIEQLEAQRKQSA